MIRHDALARFRTTGRVAVYLTTALLTAALTACATSSWPAGTGSAQFVGFRWRIGAVQHGATRVTIPTALRGYVGFARDHTLSADDSVNSYFGVYRVGSGGYQPANVGTTLVGYAGHDPARLALIDAVDALTRSSTAVTARLDGDTLQLSTAGYTITCTKLGNAPIELPASPTSTHS